MSLRDYFDGKKTEGRLKTRFQVFRRPLVYLPFVYRLFNAQYFQRIGRTGFAHLRTAGDDVLVAGA